MACQICGSEVASSGKGRPRKYCLGCGPRKRPLSAATTAICPVCEAAFIVAGNMRYCSAACRYTARDVTRRVPCASCGEPIHRSSTSRPVGEARCRGCWRNPCGTLSAYRRGCRCVECRKANAEASRQYGRFVRHQWIDPRERAAIYERDGWICQLCREPVDLIAHHLNARAPTLDHIEPRSLALFPDHRPTNLRTAHRGCNSARGNRVSA